MAQVLASSEQVLHVPSVTVGQAKQEFNRRTSSAAASEEVPRKNMLREGLAEKDAWIGAATEQVGELGNDFLVIPTAHFV